MPVSTSDIDITESYPTIRPSLNLNFARSRSLDPRITFTRASTATYVGRDGLIKTAGENEPRFDHDPDTLESLGLLIEESRTNQHGNHDFSSGWALNNASFTTGISDPEGGTNARKLVVGGAVNGTAASFITDNTSITSGVTYTQSLWAKENAAGNFYSTVQIAPSTGFTQAYRNFDLSNGTLGSGDIPEGDCKIEKYPNGWYRVSVTATATQTVSGRMAIALADSPTSGRIPQISVGSANNDGIYIWGVQLEVGTFPTSLIKTSGSSATRAADLAIAPVTGKDFYNFNEGTYLVEGIINATLPANTFGGIFGIGSGGGNSNFLNYNPANFHGYYASNTGQSPSSSLTKSYTPGAKYKLAGSYDSTGFSASMDGDISSNTTTGVLNNTNNGLFIGSNAITSSTFGVQTIARASYYTQRLTNAQLQLLTS